MNNFAEWLSTTFPSLIIQNHEVWMIPTVQCFHIVGIGLAIGSSLMITLRVLGWANMDQSLLENQRRFGPWLTFALLLLLASGSLLVIGEPVRELVTFSFWLKMFLVGVVTSIAVAYQLGLRTRQHEWQGTLVHLRSVRITAVLTFAIWACIIMLGRLIAYDHIWGSLSPATKA